MTLAAREEEACLASMKIASPIFRNYEGSTCIVRSKSTIRKGDEITDNYGFFYQIHPEEERRETLSKQGPFINYFDLGWGQSYIHQVLQTLTLYCGAHIGLCVQ